MFGLTAPTFDQIVDTKKKFTDSERKALSRHITRFEKKFPQIKLCFLITEIPARYDISLFAFWYFNVAPFREKEDASDRSWSILLCYDLAEQRISITSGYYVEAFVSDDKLDAILRSVKNQAQQSGRISALKHYIEKLSELLTKSHRHTIRSGKLES